MAEDGRKVRWEEMLPEELLEAIRQHPVCYAAYGLAEPHGRYSALGLDWIKAQAIVERAAVRFGGVVAPPCCWHVQERPEFDYFAAARVTQPLTTGIPADLWLHLVLHHVRTFDARGFHAAILLTGHYGGLENDMRLLCEYYVRRTGSPLRIAAFADCEIMRFENYRGDHAGICETSQLMAVRPDLVDLSRKEEESRSGPWAGTKFPLADGRMPSRELGEKIVAAQVERLGEVQRELLDGYRDRPGWRAPTLNYIEALWNRFERLTRKYWWLTLALGEYYAKQRIPFPGWDALGE
jgi:creatinine amidohydrolase